MSTNGYWDSLLRKRLSRRRLLRSGAVAGAATLGLIGCTTPAPPSGPAAVATQPASGAQAAPIAPTAGQPGGTLRVGFPGEPNHLDPDLGPLGFGLRMLHSVYDSLLFLDENGAPKPGLAESWEVAPSGLVVTLKLRRGVKFHDGTDFNAEAVKFNLDRRRDPDNKSDALSQVADIDSVEIADAQTVKLNLKRKSAPLIFYLADHAGIVASPAAIQAAGKDFGRKPVGTGPFTFVEWVSNDHITMKRFDGYWGNKAKVDELIFRFYPIENDRITNLRTGQVDLIILPPSKDVEALKAGRFADLAYSAKPSGGYQSIYMSWVNPPFDNKAMREAVYYAVDREAMFKIAGNGVGELANAYGIGPSSPLYSKDFPLVKRDLAKARAKLAEAGLPSGFEATFLAPPGAEYENIAQLLQQQLGEIGIRVKVETLQVTQLVDRVVVKRDHQFYTLVFGAAVDPDDSIVRRLQTGAPFNNAKYSRPEIDRLFTAARETYDPKERSRLFAEAMKLHEQDPVLIFLWFISIDVAYNKKVRNYTVYPTIIQRWNEATVR